MPTKMIYNATTGERTVVELSQDEVAQLEAMSQAAQEQQAAMEAEIAAKQALKESAKAKLIAGEPLTPEEADTLVL